ncbi:MAG: DUF58 domain-containing protein, partial [Armatimonadetes bacterium]|nr:DUF58 domain-containing protein [Armatimonadota bacterium]
EQLTVSRQVTDLQPRDDLLTRSKVAGHGPEKLSLGVNNRISLHLRNRSSLRLLLTVKDDPPTDFSVSARTLTTLLAGRTEASLHYHVRPLHRGDYRFGDLYLRYVGILGMIVRQKRIPAAQEVKVYPNLLDVRKYDLLARRGRLMELGIRAAVLRGRGTEFESLRDYQPDDEFRHIHWKATARRGKLISVQHQVERSQNILVLLDCGRMMATQVTDSNAAASDGTTGKAGLSRLDCAINATLMISYVAAVMDDKVGLLAFSDGIHTYLPPRKGRGQVYRIMESLYPLESDLVESDYRVAFQYLMSRSPKRTLVILFTDLVDADVSKEMLSHLMMLHPAHLPMCVTLSSSDILAMAGVMPGESQQAYEKALAVHVLKEREEALRTLRSRGVFVVDVPPENLSVAVVNKYLELKARTLL